MTGSFRDECAESYQICLAHLALCWLRTSKFIQERHLDLVNVFLVDLMLRINNEDMFLFSDICGSDMTDITVSSEVAQQIGTNISKQPAAPFSRF
jgi:hypothetical protein